MSLGPSRAVGSSWSSSSAEAQARSSGSTAAASTKGEAKPSSQAVEGIALVEGPGACAAAELFAQVHHGHELGPCDRIALPGVLGCGQR